MGKDFYEEYEDYRNFCNSVNVSFDHRSVMHNGPMEDLSDTRYTQPCMSVFAAGVTNLLVSHGVEPEAVCGLSLGEYGALYAAGVFSAQDFVKMTEFRGGAMAEAAKGLSCSMSAILGTDSRTVEDACKAYAGEGFVTVANYNCAGQYVICGTEQAVADTEARLVNMGAKRCVRLNVSGPFHTHCMKPAGDKLANYLKSVEFHVPRIPVALNVSGTFYKDGDDLKANLEQQVQNSVRLEDDLQALIAAGYRRYIEIGPGNVVSGFLKKTARAMGANVEVTAVETVEDFKKRIGE